jgi:hypothetical protein
LLKAAAPEKSLVVPQAAIQIDQSGPFALVVNSENKIEVRRIEPGQTEGSDATCSQGLGVGDRIVTEGIQKVRPGQVVAPSKPSRDPEPCCRGFSSIGHGLRSSYRSSSPSQAWWRSHVIPIAQFPDIVPPQVSVSVSYPGASAEMVQQSIAQPIESRVVGVDNMIYMKSTSGNDGSYTLTVSFAVGTDPDINTVNVQNRVNLAEAQLPQEARAQGISVKKKSSALMQLIALTSERTESTTSCFLSNYATINIIDGLKRIKGVGDVTRC